ncbi:MAG: FliH/SctL family protein [Paracoccaceae bacterium]
MAASTEQTSRPLDAAEISRMFEAMRSGSFTAAPETARPAKSAFVAKSLFDIARAAGRSDRVAAAKMPGAALAEIEDAEVLSEEPLLAESPASAAFDLTPEDGAGDVAAMDGIASEFDPTVSQPAETPVDPGPRPPNPEELKAEWGRGFAAGEAHAREQMSTAVGERLAVLAGVAEAFRSADAVANLRQEIIEAVRHLASLRAGSQIDEMPIAYLARIEDLVDRIGHSLAQPRLRLNPEDLAAVKPYLANSETLSPVSISADPDLARGDFEVSTDSLRYADKMAPKPQASAKVRRNVAPRAEGDQDPGTGLSE